MRQTLARWIVVIIAALLVGPLAGKLTGSVRGLDGGPDATALVSDAPIAGMIYSLGAVALAAAVGLASSYFCGPRVGLVGAGIVLAWGAWASGRLDGIVRGPIGDGVMIRIALESALLGAAVLAASLAIIKVGAARDKDRGNVDALFTPQAAGGLAVVLVLGAMVGAAVARSSMVGQTFAAAVAAGLVGTVVGRSVVHRAPLGAFLAGGVVLAVAGPAAAGIMSGGGLREAVYRGSVLALGRPMPLDWLAGMLVGVPMGAAWAASMVEKPDPAPK